MGGADWACLGAGSRDDPAERRTRDGGACRAEVPGKWDR